MKSPQDIALQRAQDYVRDRGWRQEPLIWEEVAELVMAMNAADLQDFAVGYDEGFEAGRAAGYERGYNDGKEIGFALAEKVQATS